MIEHFAPNYWRMRAAEALALAASISDEEAKQIMTKIANDYEQMARTAEGIQKRSPSDHNPLNARPENIDRHKC